MKYRALLFMLAVFASSCSGLRTVTEEDPLYTGTDVKISGEISKDRNKEISREIEEGVRPLPNKTFLRIFRPRLALYHLAREAKPEGRGFRHWLKYQVGEAPVTLSKFDQVKNKALVEQHMNDKGFFKPEVEHRVHQRKKVARVEYIIESGPEYTIASIQFPKSDSLVRKTISAFAPASLIRPGMPYDLSMLKDERVRIDSSLKNSGFFYFQPDFLVFKADTTSDGNKVRLSLDLKEDIPLDAEKKMVINRIIVNSEFTFPTDTAMATMDTLNSEGIEILYKGSPILNPEVISRAVAFRIGKEYRISDHDKTISRLTALGIYKFVNISFAESDTSDTNRKLDCTILLTPLQKRSIRMELQGVTKSNNFAGPVVSLAYRNRNMFRNAELFQLNLNTSFQTQIRKRQAPLNSYELSSNARLYIPRIVAPFARVKESRLYTPRTKIEAGTGIFNRVNFYSMISLYGSYGYLWRETEEKLHELNPVAINFLDLTSRTSRFQELLDKNLLLRNSFEEQFIIGSNYTFLYTRLSPKVPYNYYLMANVDVSGNSANLFERITGKDPFDFAGLTYSQYSRVEADGRFYYDITPTLKFATRLILGAGVPYGNSNTLPYIKQFFSGGSNSIRAFPARAVGPGVYSPSSDSDLTYFEQGGEMKLENSIELRYALTKIIKPAIFLDAGNVWLMKKRADLPGGEFKPDQIFNQLAVGAGAGLRLDVSILILRFDLAFPLMSPNDYTFRAPVNGFSTRTFAGKYVLNVALGYPF